MKTGGRDLGFEFRVVTLVHDLAIPNPEPHIPDSESL